MGQDGSKAKAPTASSSGGTVTNLQNNNNNNTTTTTVNTSSPPPIPGTVTASVTGGGGEGGTPRADGEPTNVAEGTPRDDPVVLAEKKLSNLRQDAMFQSDDNAGDAKAAVESDEEEADFSFNFNSESSDEEIKFPTSAALLIPSIEISDPFVDLDTSTKRVAKDFIGSDA